MAVNKIVDGALTLDISDPRLQEKLSVLNRNGDDKISVEDFEMGNASASAYVPKENKLDAMRNAVAAVFVKSGIIKESQRQGMAGFFRLYSDMKRASAIVRNWMSYHTDTWGGELEFGASYYKSGVFPHITGNGVLSAAGCGVNVGSGLGSNLIDVMISLTGQPNNSPSSCGTSAPGFQYNGNQVPEILRKHIDQVMVLYNGIHTYLKEYREIECEDDGCPKLGEVPIFLLSVEKGSETKYRCAVGSRRF